MVMRQIYIHCAYVAIPLYDSYICDYTTLLLLYHSYICGYTRAFRIYHTLIYVAISEPYGYRTPLYLLIYQSVMVYKTLLYMYVNRKCNLLHHCSYDRTYVICYITVPMIEPMLFVISLQSTDRKYISEHDIREWKFEVTKGTIENRKLKKDIQYHDQKTKDKMVNSIRQRSRQKTPDWVKHTPSSDIELGTL